MQNNVPATFCIRKATRSAGNNLVEFTDRRRRMETHEATVEADFSAGYRLFIYQVSLFPIQNEKSMK